MPGGGRKRKKTVFKGGHAYCFPEFQRGKNLGTAFKISDDIVLTAAHNVAQRDRLSFVAISELEFRLLPGEESPIVFSDFDHFSRQENDLPHLRGEVLRKGVGSGHYSDWAIIKISPPANQVEAAAWNVFRQLPNLPLQNHQSSGAVLLIGYPATCALFQDGRALFHKVEWSGSTIKRNELKGWRIWMSSFFHGDSYVLAPGLNHGNSGAPIVKESSEGPVAVGILTGGDEYSGQGFYVQITSIWNDLTEFGIVQNSSPRAR